MLLSKGVFLFHVAFVIFSLITPKNRCSSIVVTAHASNHLLSRIGSHRASQTKIQVISNSQYDSSISDSTSTTLEKSDFDYFIRDAKFSDLPNVTQIIVDSFYDKSAIWRHYHLISELNRLQTNFPYNLESHVMFVSCRRSDGTILGFVDIDCRPSRLRNAPPRPYLSDLAVKDSFRRKGIATSLIKSCESFVRSNGEPCLHLRVERSNTAALIMYSLLGYDKEPSDIFGVIDTTILLKRVF